MGQPSHITRGFCFPSQLTVLPGLPCRLLLTKTIGTTGSKDEMYLVSKYITKRQKNGHKEGQEVNYADHKETERANDNDMDLSTNSSESGNAKNVGSPLKLQLMSLVTATSFKQCESGKDESGKEIQ